MAHYDANYGINVTAGTYIDKSRLFDVRDEKWAHPELQEGWVAGASSAPLYDPTSTLEENHQKADAVIGAIFEQMGVNTRDTSDDPCTVTKYMVPGCPEEPDAEVEVYVYRPKTLKSKKARCMFYALAGALVCREPEIYPVSMFAENYRCVCVVAKYRQSYIAPYPAAINDCHAAYQWMLDNAEELKINPDNIVIYGQSSGGHLSLSLGFRLKRYHVPAPKGIVAYMPQTDDRAKNSLSYQVYTGVWDSVDQHNALLQYAGAENFASGKLGPEYLANYATVEECKGYPPTYIFTVEYDPDRVNCMELYNKLSEAKTYCHFSSWPGAHHMSGQLMGVVLPGETVEYGEVMKAVLDKAINDCFNYDLRRPWVTEE